VQWAPLVIILVLLVACVALALWGTRKRDAADDARRDAAREKLKADKLERRESIQGETDDSLLERPRAVRRKRDRSP
jgi:hypothetical protein